MAHAHNALKCVEPERRAQRHSKYTDEQPDYFGRPFDSRRPFFPPHWEPRGLQSELRLLYGLACVLGPLFRRTECVIGFLFHPLGRVSGTLFGRFGCVYSLLVGRFGWVLGLLFLLLNPSSSTGVRPLGLIFKKSGVRLAPLRISTSMISQETPKCASNRRTLYELPEYETLYNFKKRPVQVVQNVQDLKSSKN